MKKLLILLLSVSLISGLYAQSQSEKEAKKLAEMKQRADRLYKGLNVERDVVYKKYKGKDVTMDIVLPTEKVFKNGAPILVNIHGGGWNGGDRYHVGGAWAKALTQKGIAIATISYTFAVEGKTDITNCIIDVKDALRFLVKNSKKYGIDPTRMMTTGHSAGGHLALLAALAPNDKFVGEPSLKKYEPKFVGAIGFAPAVSFVNPEADYKGTVSYGAYCFARLMGGSLGEIRDFQKECKVNSFEFLKAKNPKDKRIALAEEVSPINYLTRNSCPILIIHGSKDDLVSYKASKLMANKAKEIGANVIYVEVTGADHGLGGAKIPQTDEEKSAKIQRFEEISVSKDAQGKLRDLFVLRYLLENAEPIK